MEIPEIAPRVGRAGMITLSWNEEDPEEIASAEKAFREYTRKGWLAFVVTSDKKRKQVFTFNPKFGRVQLVPLIRGG
ncbi:MAG: hypothetical protein ACE5Z5_14150 [Candidatus Bathyarchaeia archaeon]